jgi:hypothetical protein
MIRPGMIRWLRTLLYRKRTREVTPEELAGLEANKQRHEQGMNRRAEQALAPHTPRISPRDSGQR